MIFGLFNRKAKVMKINIEINFGVGSTSKIIIFGHKALLPSVYLTLQSKQYDIKTETAYK